VRLIAWRQAELRAEYGAEDIVSTKLCRDDEADKQIAATGDAWRLTLIAKGFREIVNVWRAIYNVTCTAR
jgi:hypothetical protein